MIQNNPSSSKNKRQAMPHMTMMKYTEKDQKLKQEEERIANLRMKRQYDQFRKDKEQGKHVRIKRCSLL